MRVFGVFRFLAVAGALIAAFSIASGVSYGSITVSGSVGGAATGVNYANFDNLGLGSGGGTSGGISVSFTPDGQVVNGSSSGAYAAPYLSGSNGVNFGNNPVDIPGVDKTNYITTGVGTATLTFSGLQQYMGILWGSIDNYNKLEFFNGATSVGVVTGTDVVASPNGNQGVNGTLYVNINSTLAFDSVVASSTQYAFEFDNVAYSASPQSAGGVPEPASLAIWGLGALGCAFAAYRRKKQVA